MVILAYPGESVDQLWSNVLSETRRGEDLAEQALLIHRRLDFRDQHLLVKDPPPEILAVYEAKRLDSKTADGDITETLDTLRIQAEDRFGTPLVLTRRNLDFSNLTGASLRHAVLHSVSFRGALLESADLTEATLRGADLTGAFLKFVQLKGADLALASLERADRTAAHLHN